ncbi:hypothetical protein FACS189442_5880 [Spirochaetia bacterium]|nr:hypothetical protein FACS189442_5880 [Spirochaetia bacterium]
MEKTGLPDRINDSVFRIDLGRKGVSTDGEEHQGRIYYQSGIAIALAAFREAQATVDCETLILTEGTFLERELQYCDSADTITRNSLTQAIQSFEDSLRSLKTVADKTLYQAAETTHPTTRNRINGLPKDVFHQACDGHRTRLSNSLRTPGINMIEKAVIQQRMANMKTAVINYKEKQIAAGIGLSTGN